MTSGPRPYAPEAIQFMHVKVRPYQPRLCRGGLPCHRRAGALLPPRREGGTVKPVPYGTGFI